MQISQIISPSYFFLRRGIQRNVSDNKPDHDDHSVMLSYFVS